MTIPDRDDKQAVRVSLRYVGFARREYQSACCSAVQLRAECKSYSRHRKLRARMNDNMTRKNKARLAQQIRSPGRSSAAELLSHFPNGKILPITSTRFL